MFHLGPSQFPTTREREWNGPTFMVYWQRTKLLIQNHQRTRGIKPKPSDLVYINPLYNLLF